MLTPASSVMERDSKRSVAPLGVGGGGTGRPEGVPSCVTWLPGDGRKARTGDVVGGKGHRYVTTLANGAAIRRKLRCTGGGRSLTGRGGTPLTRKDARRIAQRLRRGERHSGARVTLHTCNILHVPVPNRKACRTRAVLAWTLRVIGRPVGIRAVKRGLALIGFDGSDIPKNLYDGK